MGRFPVQSWVGIGTNIRPARPVGGVNGTGTRGSRMFGGKGDGGRTGDRVGAFGHVGVVTSERRADMLGRRTGQDMVPVAAMPPSSSTTASTASRPRLRPHVVIVVEGINDARNVRRYLDVDIYVLGSATKTGTSATQEELRGLQSRYRRIVLLLDPDVAGRQARNDIDRLLGGDKCWHAFIPTLRATLGRETRYKGAGDVGVEHASGEAVRQAIRRSRPSRGGNVGAGVGGGLPFDRGMLMELGLVAEMGVRGRDVTRRRELVCAWLGIGVCDGKQLLRQLNTYGFTPDELDEALAYAKEALVLDPGDS